MPSQTAYAPETVTGRTTSYMALTTPFIPSAPVKCKSAYMWEERIVAYDPAYGVSVDSNLVCGPAAFTTWWMQGRLGDGDTRISIGPLTCPQDWSTVVSSIRSKSSTLQMCCPSGFHLTSGTPGEISGDCVSDVSAGATITYRSSVSTESSYAVKTTTLKRKSTIGAIAIVGWNIDLPTPTSTAMTSSEPATSTPLPTETPTDTSNGTNSKSSSSLSTGAKAGVGVGVGVGAVGVIALLVALWMFRRRRKEYEPAGTSPPVTQYPSSNTPSNMYSSSGGGPSQPPGDSHGLNQPWYHPSGVIVPPSNSDHMPSSNSQTSNMTPGASQGPAVQSDTTTSSASNAQRGVSPHQAPPAYVAEAPTNQTWLAELQGSTVANHRNSAPQELS